MAASGNDNLWEDLEGLVGATLAGRFRLDRMLGKGGYGAVFEAQQTSVNRRCAVKVLVPHIAADRRNATRFEREARMTSQLAHPNTVVIYDFGLDEERSLLFLAMEYLEGESLRDRIREAGQLDVASTVWIAHQAARSLQDAHDRGLVHRDVKPHNIMVLPRDEDPNFVKVIDFGIAKFLEDEAVRDSLPDVTQTGMVIGTPAYMAPEQVRNRPLDGRTDQYALATCVYQMLSGRTVFLGESPVDIATKQLIERPLPLSAFCPDLPVERDFDDVLLRALSKDAGHRFDTMREFADALADAANVKLPGALDTGERSRPGRREETPRTIPAVRIEVDAEADTAPSDPLAATDEELVGTTEQMQTFDDEPGGTLQVSPPRTASAADSTESPTTAPVEARPPNRIVGAVVAGALLLVAVAAIAYLKTRDAPSEPPVAGGGTPAADSGQLTADNDDPTDHAEREPNSDVRVATTAQPDASSEKRAARSEEPEASSEKRAARSEEPEASSEKRAARSEKPAAKTGTLTVTVVPWGTLFVDGARQGEGGKHTMKLPAGTHELELRQNGQTRARKTVDVREGRNRMIELIAR